MASQTMARQANKAAKGEDESPQSRMARHDGLKLARQKLKELENGRATVQAKIDQARAAMHDTGNIADKLLAGEPLTIADSVNTEAETAKLKGYELAIARQRAEVEQELRSASREVCDIEADGHKERAAKFVELANNMIQTFNEMEGHVAGLRNAGVQLDNRFPLYDAMRFRTLIQAMKPIVDLFSEFSK
jgi:uncharacterized membrane protein